MRWGMIGGGHGSQIGEAHRIAARHDGLFAMTAAALDVDAVRGREFAREIGFEYDRSYGDWKQFIAAERGKPEGERLDLVTVATPNATHYEISRALLKAGFNVLCEKPLTMTVAEGDDLLEVARNSNLSFGVNFGYSGYPMAIQAREMVRRGDLGDVRVVMCEFSHGFHADASDADNPRIRWRYDPAQAGVSSVVADLGTHVFHMAQFMTSQKITAITAQFDRCVAGRQLEDDALLAFRFDGGAVGRLWTSAIATGQAHGFSMRLFGSKGGVRWHQEFPNQLYFSPLNEPTRILERGDPSLYPETKAASRIAIGHAEGMLEAFANIYKGMHDEIGAKRAGKMCEGPLGFPPIEDGVVVTRMVHAAAQSASENGAWIRVADVK